MNLATYLNLESTSRMHGALPPFPHIHTAVGKVKLSVPGFNQIPRHEDVGGVEV
jgi:hypothetical protein